MMVAQHGQVPHSGRAQRVAGGGGRLVVLDRAFSRFFDDIVIIVGALIVSSCGAFRQVDNDDQEIFPEIPKSRNGFP